MKKRSRLLWIFLLLVLIALALYALRAPLSVAVAKRVALSHLAADVLSELPDGLHVGLCGAGSPMPDEKRGGPCTLVVVESRPTW